MRTVRSADGTPIALEESGEGPALVLVEGALNERSTMLPFVGLLRGRFRVVVYDRRGRGASGDGPVYDVRHEVDDLAAVIDDIGEPAAVFGNCSGSGLVLSAARAGVGLRAAVLYEPPFRTRDGRGIPADYRAGLLALDTAGRPADTLRYFMREGVQLPAAQIDQIAASPMWPVLERIAHTLVYDNAVMGGDYRLPDWLDEVTAPTVVLDGSRSADWARQSVADLAAALPRGRRRTLEGQTHLLVPEAVAPTIAEELVLPRSASVRGPVSPAR